MSHRQTPAPATSAEPPSRGKVSAPAGRPRLTRLPRARTVVFDCDSTLSAIEGVEELGREHRAEIERLTEAAMDGSVPLEDVYGRRLALANPTRRRVEALTRRYVEALVPDARETIAALRAEGLEVRVLSGGLLPAVRGVAVALGLPAEAAAAVGVYFDASGGYAGFDTASPLARAGGKAVVLDEWRTHLDAPILLVGDGATDLEARFAVDGFIAFAGVIDRPAVTAAADVVVRVRSLAPILPLALGGDPPRDRAALPLFERGLSLLDDAARAAIVPHANDSGR